MTRGFLFCVFGAGVLGNALFEQSQDDLTFDLARRDGLATVEDLALARRQFLTQRLSKRELDDEFVLVARMPPRFSGGGLSRSGGSTRSGGSPRAANPARNVSPSSPTSESPDSPFCSAHSSGSGSFSRPDTPWGSPTRQEGILRGSSSSSNPYSSSSSQEGGLLGLTPRGSPPGSPRGSPRAGVGSGRSPAPAQPDAKAHGYMSGSGTIYKPGGAVSVYPGEQQHAATSHAEKAGMSMMNIGDQSKSTLHATGRQVRGSIEYIPGRQHTGVLQTFSPAGVETKIAGKGEDREIKASAPPGKTAAVKVQMYGPGRSDVRGTNRQEET